MRHERDPRRPLVAEHGTGLVGLHDVARRGGRASGGRVPWGAADETKPAAPGTVEAWGRSEDNPVGGWYGLRKGYRGRFGMYLPPLLEERGLTQVSHDARNNRMRAI